ncbi:MAG: MATE family efflux transporter, partial [Muribaculaceae bacterium]|nr:MATE family efflux transporter [Muribaculaceae bacterium]
MSRYLADYRRIIALGCPILVSQLGMIVVGFADNSMVGHYSTDALSAASFVNNVFNLAVLGCLGFTYGLTPLIGALFTIADNHGIGTMLRDGLRLNVIYALLLTAAMAVVYAFLPNLGQPEHLLPLIRPYFLLYLAGVLPIAIFNVFAQAAYALNSTKMPMWIILASNCINIFGNWVLIYGNLGVPEMGLTGAGVSTLVARWFCPVIIYLVFMRGVRYSGYKSAFKSARFSIDRRRKIFTTSLPVSLQLMLETGSFSIAAVMAGWLGAVELAAFQIILITGTLGFCVYYSFGSATSVLVANAAGAKDNMRMRQVATAGYHVTLVLCLISSAIFYFAGRFLFAIFTDDRVVLDLTITLIPPLMLYQIADATQINYSSALRGTGNVMPMLLTAFVSYAVVGVPATYILTFTFCGGMPGLVSSFSISLFCAAVMYFIYFMRTTRSLN